MFSLMDQMQQPVQNGCAASKCSKFFDEGIANAAHLALKSGVHFCTAVFLRDFTQPNERSQRIELILTVNRQIEGCLVDRFCSPLVFVF